MSKYTTELRYICEINSDLFDSVGYYSINEVIEKSRQKIFCFDYPIFDEKYRTILERKILKHYYTREIGFESIGLWQLKLETKLNEIMPYYNKLYKSELLDFNPLHDTNITKTYKLKSDNHRVENDVNVGSVKTNATSNVNDNVTSNGNSNVTDNGTSKDLYSDTPQGALTGVDNEQYLTNARKIIGNNNSTTNTTNSSEKHSTNTNQNNTETKTNNKLNSTINNIDDYLEEVSGKSGGVSMSEMVLKYRETFLNIDMLVIDELSDLFMLLW